MDLEYKKLTQVKNRVKYQASIKKEELDREHKAFITKLGRDVKVPGFRPGKAPQAEIEKAVGYNAYIEAINSLLPKTALEILKKESLNPISSLDYNFDDNKDSKDDKTLVFTFEFLTQPDIDVSKFKKIKVKKEEVKVTDKDINDTIQSLIKTSLPREKWEKHIKKDSKDSELEITEELIKDVGFEDAKSLKEFQVKVRESLENVKNEQAQNKYVATIVEEALKLSDFEVPHEYVHREMEHREGEFKKRIDELKLNMEVYLRSQNKTIESLREEWHKQSELDLSTDLLLINISVKEKLIPTDKEADEEISKLDKESQEYYKVEANRDYLKTALSRNKGLLRLVDIVEGK